jgi:hypothetical protein
MDTDTYTAGDRVRLTCPTPSARAGDEAIVREVVQNQDGTVKVLVVLVDSDPTRTHGTTVFPTEVEKVFEKTSWRE